MKQITKFFMAAALCLPALASTRAGELDPAVNSLLPHQLLVRVDNSSGETTVFKSYVSEKIGNNAEALNAINDTEKANLTVSAKPMSELDRDSSVASWCYYRGPSYGNYNWYYGYYYGGYNYGYTPYYNYSYYRYTYYYYWY